MNFLKRHSYLLDKVLSEKIEQEDGEEESFDRNEEREKEESRLPSDANLVEYFEDQVENWTSWTLEEYFFVCHITEDQDIFILIQLSWDDNWGRWEWYSCAAISGAPDQKSATKELLKHFAKERIEGNGDDEWRCFLKRLIDDNS